MATSLLAKNFDRLVVACAAVAGLMILSTVLMITADVIGRYFFSVTFPWIFELTEHILVSIPFLGMAWLVRSETHVRIDILLTTLPKRLRGWADSFAYGLSAATCAFMTYYALLTTIDHYLRGIVTYGIYPIPKFLLLSVITFGLALTAIEFLRKTVEPTIGWEE